MLSPLVFNLILGGIAAEYIGLAWVMRRRGLARWTRTLFWFLLSGAMLMLAVRNALAGAGEIYVAAPLIASLLTHVACLWTGWQAARAPARP